MEATREHPIVVVDISIDHQWVLVSGLVKDSQIASYWVVPTKEVTEVGVSIPEEKDLAASTYLRQMHTIAALNQRPQILPLSRDYWMDWTGGQWVAIFGNA